jgi:radical SAM protein with 4Fe4S-binding SPASM domain
MCLRLRWRRSVKVRLPLTKRQSARSFKSGLFAYTQETEAGRAQIHLRIDLDGTGLLLINANQALHLNPTAARMTWLVLEDVPDPVAVREIRKTFKVRDDQARSDFNSIREQISALIEPNGVCPIHDLALDILPPFAAKPSAPYRMDLALTYRCNDNCPHCYNARSRDYPELDTVEWMAIIDNLWNLGIPHICFTGGEATLRSDLPELVAHAQSKGQITGLLSNGRRLSDRRYLDELVAAGLDHIQITLESHHEEVHDRMVAASGAYRQTVEGIRNCVDAGLYLMTNTTLLEENGPGIAETVDFLADLGVKTVGINALIYSGKGATVGTGMRESDLGPLLEHVREKTDGYGQRLIWYTPTQYCHFDPVQMELGVKACTAALYNMCVEPNGDVLPCQSYYEPLGHMLRDPWDSIWNHELAIKLRERQYIPEACAECAVLAECGGGCPLTLLHRADQEPLTIEILENTST